MTFPLFHCSLHSRPHHAVSVQCCCSDTQRHVRSHFDSKALHFRIRPYCHKRGLRVSGGECGAAYAMWHPFGLPSPIRGGQMLAVHGRKTVCALKFSCVQNEGWGGKCWGRRIARPLLAFRCAIWERKGRTNPIKKNGNMPGLFAYSGIRMPGSFFAKKAVSTTRQSSPNFINANKKRQESVRKFAHYCFSLLDKILVKDIGSGTATAASRYSHRRESVQPPPLIV